MSARAPLIRTLLAAAAFIAALAPLALPAATVPSGFTDSTIASGLSSPTAMELLPDGRILVAEQGGNLRVVKNNALLATPFLTVSVNSSGERGLIGVTIDPNFATNGFVYVYYTTSGAPIHNRISRFTASGGNPDVSTGTETILVDLDNLSAATNHNGGALHFGPDGKLYVAVGDNATGANAQSMSTRHGKILRYNADGTIPSDNPFFATATGANRAIWALGLRNPFTFAFQSGTGFMYINDVGQSTWEEVNEGLAGANYGWPTSEGFPGCTPAFTCPDYVYDHSLGCAITGGAFYNPTTSTFPAGYAGRYFFAEYCSNWIRYIDPANPPANNAATSFASGVSNPVDLRVAADGSLYYLARGAGSVGRIQYTANEPPSITQHPSNQTVPVNTTAVFTVSASGTPTLTYQWQKNLVDIPGATSATLTLNNVPLADNGAQYRCVVTNGFGFANSNPATLTVTTNTAPTATITLPAAGAHYNAGQTITYAGTGTDTEDVTIPASGFTWQVDFHHDAHTHPFIAPTSGATGGSFVIPNTGETSANVWYRIHLTVRDSGSLTHSTFRDVVPNTATITLASNPTGLQLTLDGQPVTAPNAGASVVGMQRTIGAPLQQSLGGTTYQFVSWSDGGARDHTIATPASNTTVTANYAVATATNVALASNGGVASASSFYSAAFAPSAANDGETAGVNWGSGGGWNDSTGGTWPDWLQINFNGQKTIDRVVVYTLQDNYAAPSPPTDAMTFGLYGVTGFQVQTWNGSTWVTQNTVTGSNLVKRTVTFPPVQTDRVRINVTSALAVYSRITEVEAWTPGGGPTPTTTGVVGAPNPSTVGQSVTFTATVNGVAPTGSVAFRDGVNTIAGCAAAALSGAGNSRTAQCATSVLAQGTRSITAVYAGDANNQTSTSPALSQVVNAASGSINVALAGNGGVATASSIHSAGFGPAGTIDGETAGAGWGTNRGWNDSSFGSWPDWLQVTFNGQKTINKVVVVTVQDNYASPSPPTDTMTFSLYGVTGFQVQTWNGNRWTTRATVTGNNLVKRTVTFPSVTTDRVRINVTSGLASYSRIVEVEAWTP